MRRMLRQILAQGHGLLYHFMVQLRGVEQMKTITKPYGKAKMGDVESWLGAGDGDNVAIVDNSAEQTGIANL